MKKLTCVLTVLLLISAESFFALPLAVDYYGVVSQSSDTNIIKMAQDIFFTQLSSIDQVTVSDKRPDTTRTLQAVPPFARTTGNRVSFYAEITETAVGSAAVEWKCRFCAVTDGGETFTKTETYDSYYKILVGAKTAIEDLLRQLPQNGEDAPATTAQTAPAPQMKAEALAGTWGGEPYTDKIVLLRGGRGFVIFKNGASMNVSVTVLSADASGNVSHVQVKQVGKPNASFYPALPRETALASAADAKPIIWNFTVTANGTLSGTKTTLVPSNDSPTGVAEGTETAVWVKK